MNPLEDWAGEHLGGGAHPAPRGQKLLCSPHAHLQLAVHLCPLQ